MSTMMIELPPLRRREPAPWATDIAPVRPAHEVYVRRRAVVALAFLCVFAVAALAIRSWSGPAGGNPASVAGRDPAIPAAVGASAGAGVPPEVSAVILVQPGDSLWSIAQEIIGDGDIARYVDELVELNGDGALVAGQALLLPV